MCTKLEMIGTLAVIALGSGCGAVSENAAEALATEQDAIEVGDVSSEGTIVLIAGEAVTFGFAQFTKDFTVVCDTQREPATQCSVTTCSGDDAGGTPTNAGEIRITGGTSPVVLSPNAGGTYDPAFVPGSVWAGGERLEVAAQGNPSGAPAFTARLTAPFPMTLTAPVFPSDTALPVSRSAPLEVTWSGPAAQHPGTIAVVLDNNGPEQHYVECHFDAMRGTGTIPESALGGLRTDGDAFMFVESAARVVRHRRHWILRSELDHSQNASPVVLQ
jgi:hypothetical protein